MFFKEVTSTFFEKLGSHFKTKNTYEGGSFIKILDNLLVQHLDKHMKKYNKEVPAEKAHAYFIYIRNLLSERKVVEGIVYKDWIDRRVNTVDEMISTMKVTIKLDVLEQQSANYKPPPSQDIKKTLRITGDKTAYAKAVYAVLLTIVQQDFYYQPGSTTTTTKYKKNIENIIKNWVNAQHTPEKQRTLFKKDKIIKHMIFAILTYNQVLEEGETLNFDRAKMDVFKQEMNSPPDEVIAHLKGTIDTIIDNQN